MTETMTMNPTTLYDNGSAWAMRYPDGTWMNIEDEITFAPDSLTGKFYERKMMSLACAEIQRQLGHAIRIQPHTGHGTYAFYGHDKFYRAAQALHFLRVCGVAYTLERHGWNEVKITI
jgi:hypothetical protein